MRDRMVQAEAHFLSQQRGKDLECECKDGMFPSRPRGSRRNFLFAVGSSAGAAAATLLAGSAVAQQAPPGAKYFDVPADPTKEQGSAGGADGGYGSRWPVQDRSRVRYARAYGDMYWQLT